jgi:hypothetical protein
MTVASHSQNGTTCARVQTHTSHVDISTCPLRDIGPPRLPSRAVDTYCPTALRCEYGMRLDSESRCRVVDVSVAVQSGQWVPRLARRPCREAGYALQRNRALQCRSGGSSGLRQLCGRRTKSVFSNTSFPNTPRNLSHA